MAIKWSDLRTRLRRFLNDTDAQNASWSSDDLLDYVIGALDAFASHTPARKQEEYELEAGATGVELPDDLMSLGPVLMTADSRVFYLKPYELKPGLDVSDVTFQPGNLGYYVWGEELKFVAATNTRTTVTIYYFGYWDRPTGDSSMIRVPRWAEEALIWYCAATATAAKEGVQASTLAQYKTRSEAGVQDNPLLEYANFAMQRYREILAEHTETDRNSWLSEVG